MRFRVAAAPVALCTVVLSGCGTAAATRAEAPKPVPKPLSTTASPTPPAAPCAGGALAIDFHGGGEGTGNDFATIVIRNTGSVVCQLNGPVLLAGRDTSGAVDTQVLRYSTAPGLVLTGNTQPVAEGQEVPPGIGVLTLVAEYRDDPTSPNGLCVAHRVVPTSWRITWADGTTTAVANHDPHQAVRLGESQFLTCRGLLGTAEPITSGD